MKSILDILIAKGSRSWKINESLGGGRCEGRVAMIPTKATKDTGVLTQKHHCKQNHDQREKNTIEFIIFTFQEAFSKKAPLISGPIA